jgi:hypothetical protein
MEIFFGAGLVGRLRVKTGEALDGVSEMRRRK